MKLGTIAVDGTKVKANASRHKAMSYARMVQSERELGAQIDALLARAKATDEAEKNAPEVDIPGEIARREERLAAIRAARERLEQRQREADLQRGRHPDDENKPRGKDGKPKGGRYLRDFGVPKDAAQENFTDPDSRIMPRAGGGFDAGYNAQTAVDETAHIVVAAELTNNASDAAQLPRMLRAVRENVGGSPEQALADTGYFGEQVFASLAGGDTELIVALGREGTQQVRFDAQRSPHLASMAAKLRTDRGKAAYRRRKWIVEPPNGWIKNVLGFRQFSLRGLERVSAEWKLVCMALNLRRMAAMAAS